MFAIVSVINTTFFLKQLRSKKLSKYNIFYVTILSSTEDGSVKALLQILYGQYLILKRELFSQNTIELSKFVKTKVIALEQLK